MRHLLFALGLGAAAGLVIRVVPADLGVTATNGGIAPVAVAATLLVAAWSVLGLARDRLPTGSRTRLLGAGMLPVTMLLAAGPVAGLYFVLWPALVLTPIALVLIARPQNV